MKKFISFHISEFPSFFFMDTVQWNSFLFSTLSFLAQLVLVSRLSLCPILKTTYSSLSWNFPELHASPSLLFRHLFASISLSLVISYSSLSFSPLLSHVPSLLSLLFHPLLSLTLSASLSHSLCILVGFPRHWLHWFSDQIVIKFTPSEKRRKKNCRLWGIWINPFTLNLLSFFLSFLKMMTRQVLLLQMSALELRQAQNIWAKIEPITNLFVIVLLHFNALTHAS